jgi:hypothetical protein
MPYFSKKFRWVPCPVREFKGIALVFAGLFSSNGINPKPQEPRTYLPQRRHFGKLGGHPAKEPEPPENRHRRPDRCPCPQRRRGRTPGCPMQHRPNRRPGSRTRWRRLPGQANLSGPARPFRWRGLRHLERHRHALR